MWKGMVGAALVVVVVVGCDGGEPATGPSPTRSASTPEPTTPTTPATEPSAPVAASCPGGKVAVLTDGLRLAVGDCLFVAGYTSKRENFRGIEYQPVTALSGLDQRTFRAKTAGRVVVNVQTYFNDCPRGPCARPNPDQVFSITITG